MITMPAIEDLADTIRQLYAREPSQAAPLIEAYLQGELQGLDARERLTVLARLEMVFSKAEPGSATGFDEDFTKSLLPLLLGKDIAATDLPTQELLTRLAQSLNTIFNTLNELIKVINTTLGGSTSGDETIRQIIGGSLEAEGERRSLEEYLDQIRKAFLTAQQASKDATRTIAGYILNELDPKGMEQATGGFRIGLLKKAEAFDLFEEKYQRVRKWFDSERFLLDFLRQFEKYCQKSFS